MNNVKYTYITFTLLVFTIFGFSQNSNLPVIQKDKTEFNFYLNGKPYLMLGGELSNSATSDADEMQWIWEKLKEMNLNTVLAPVYWELIEPQEGQFDFSLVDAMINQAREKDLHLVFLWFGTWKNSMSCYAPGWIKEDYKRFPRTLDERGNPSEIVTAFSSEILKSDINAFTKLMAHIKTIDAQQQTVIMIQVENEIGNLPNARDHSALANKVFQADVPKELMDYLSKNKKDILPYVKDGWAANGYKTKGNWVTIFSKSSSTDEIFMAYNYAKFANAVAKAGKAEYDLPMYVNAALNRTGYKPGQYPSGGPLPFLLNIWQAGAPDINMLSPDIYHGDFREWLAMFDKFNNPIFIPEIRMDAENAAQVFYAIGKYKSLGFCPFSIEYANEKEAVPLSKSYKVLSDLSTIITENRNKTDGAYLLKENPTDTIVMGDYQILMSHIMTLPWSDGARAETWSPAGGIIIQTAPNEFWIGGTSITCTFKNIKNKSLTTGILSADIAKKLSNNDWKFIHINGDQTHQGRHMRIGSNEWQIQRIRVYNYK